MHELLLLPLRKETMNELRYLWYVIRHKWFVFWAGVEWTEAPLHRLIIHDWSKFTPTEWEPYVNTFYRKPWESVPELGETIKKLCQEDFNRAWLHHQRVNKHHWQYWVLREDDGNTIPMKMPDKYVREMVADWAGAGRAITGSWELWSWYDKNKEKILLHAETRRVVEWLIERVNE
jgi:hypothetical protein